jgi:hypothetical protein
MTEIIPFFSGLISLLFSVGFLLALREMKNESLIYFG